MQGRIRDGTTVRVNSTGDRNARSDVAARLALYKIALLAREAGYERFAVVKQSCGSMLMSGLVMYHTCKATARLLRDGEEAVPEGRNKISYFNASEVIVAVEAEPRHLQKY